MEWDRLSTINWGQLASLKLQAQTIAEGFFSGGHRSLRRGVGVDFIGHRTYMPGDELRFIDARASMRSNHRLVRQFTTETERTLRLIVDSTLSMGYCSPNAPASKVAFASLIAAVCAKIALTQRDPVGLDWITDSTQNVFVKASLHTNTFEKIVDALQQSAVSGDARANPKLVSSSLAPLLHVVRRGSMMLVLSDLLDLSDDTPSLLAAFSARKCSVVVVQVLDPYERDFPFNGPLVLKSIEHDAHEVATVQTDATVVREVYQKRMQQHFDQWQQQLSQSGIALLRAVTTDDPLVTVTRIVRAFTRSRHDM